MRKISFVLLTVTAIAFSALMVVRIGTAQDASEGSAEPKHSIKDVMVAAHKGGLLKKVLEGKATLEEKLTLLDHYVSLTESKPPKGEEESWEKKTNAVVVAAAKVAVGRDDGTALLKKVTNCAACHKEHKPAE